MEGYEFTVCVAHQAEHIENPGQKQENTCNTEHIFEGYLLDVKPNGIFPAGHVSEDSIACHLTLQYNGTTGDRNVIKSENMSDIDEAEEPFNVVTIKPELDYNTVGKGDETNLLECDSKCEVEDAILVFGTKREPFQNSLDDHVEQFEFVSVPSPLSENKRSNGKLPKLLGCTEPTITEEDFEDYKNIHLEHPDRLYPTKQHLGRHEMSQLKPHKCPKCDKAFVLKRNLNCHVKSRHLKATPNKCPDCGKSFTTGSNLKHHHKVQHLKLKPHKCLKCDKCFATKQGLNLHGMSLHFKARPYKCLDCGKSFAKQYNLQQHQMSQHLKLKPYKCPECEKTFASKQGLNLHEMYQHSKATPHKCPDCGKGYAAKASLEYHRTSQHLKFKRFICSKCDKGFASKHSLNTHETSQHLTRKPYECIDCDKSYSSKERLERHQMSQHLKLKPYKCPKCDKHLASKRNLDRHLEIPH